MIGLLILLLTTVCASGAPVKVLTHATVIDGSGGPPIPDAGIVIDNGRIREMGPAEKIKIPAGADVIDLTGKTIIPGIINLHGHVGMVRGLSQDPKHYDRENILDQLRTYATYGITATSSLGIDTDLMLEIRDAQRQGQLNGARVYTALRGFTVENGYPTHVPGLKGLINEVRTAGEARSIVNQLASKGADVVKIWVDSHHGNFPKVPPEIYSAIIDEAHKKGLKVFAHVYELSDAKGLVRAGIDVLAHSVRDAEVDAGLIREMKRKGVTAVPTLTREQSTFVYVNPPTWLDDPFFKKGTSSDIIESLKTTVKETQSKDPELEINRRGFAIAMRNLKKLADGGVRIGFGTDSGPPARFPGFFEHWEMELMVEAGLTPMQIIQTFSKNAAEALGISKDLGTLMKGKMADLVILDESPLENIRKTRRIHAVYIGGQKVK